MVMAATTAETAASATGRALRSFFCARAVIDFLEQLVVLADLRVVRFELERFFVGVAGLVEHALVLVGDAEIVVRGGVCRVELDRFLPAVDRFAPEPALRHVDAEFHLRSRLAPRVGKCRRNRSDRKCQNERCPHLHGWLLLTIATRTESTQGIWREDPAPVEQAMCHSGSTKNGLNPAVEPTNHLRNVVGASYNKGQRSSLRVHERGRFGLLFCLWPERPREG